MAQMSSVSLSLFWDRPTERSSQHMSDSDPAVQTSLPQRVDLRAQLSESPKGMIKILLLCVFSGELKQQVMFISECAEDFSKKQIKCA